MDHYVGIDVSLEYSSVCVVDGSGKMVCEAKLESEPEVLITWFVMRGLELTRIGLEAGPLSQWLYAAMREAGLAVELLETRHVRNLLKLVINKTDRNDARGIAQLMLHGWFKPVDLAATRDPAMHRSRAAKQTSKARDHTACHRARGRQ